MYTIFDTEAVLGVPADIRITDKSGRGGVAHWINLHLGLSEDEEVSKDHPGVQEILKRITDEYRDGRVTIMSDAEMAELVAEEIPELADKAGALLS
jgi:hypothetical protein